jgi:hypothetical protein
MLGCRMQTIGHRKHLGISHRIRSQLRVIGPVRFRRNCVFVTKLWPFLVFLSQMANNYISNTASKKKVSRRYSMLPPPDSVFRIIQNTWVVSLWKMAWSTMKSRCTLVPVTDSQRWDLGVLPPPGLICPTPINLLPAKPWSASVRCVSHIWAPLQWNISHPWIAIVLPRKPEFALWKAWDLKKKTPPLWPWHAIC